MEPLLTFAGFVAVFAASLPIAFGLEWLCLRGVFRCLPAANRAPRASSDAVRRPGVAPRLAAVRSRFIPAL